MAPLPARWSAFVSLMCSPGRALRSRRTTKRAVFGPGSQSGLKRRNEAGLLTDQARRDELSMSQERPAGIGNDRKHDSGPGTVDRRQLLPPRASLRWGATSLPEPGLFSKDELVATESAGLRGHKDQKKMLEEKSKICSGFATSNGYPPTQSRRRKSTGNRPWIVIERMNSRT